MLDDYSNWITALSREQFATVRKLDSELRITSAMSGSSIGYT